MYNEKMLTDLYALGVREGMRLLMHSSYKSLGKDAGGPDTVLDTLIKSVGGDGTLLLPTLSYESVNSGNPYFDVRETFSCVGILPEIFRKRPGVSRSLAPTHSVAAFGKDAALMTGEHHLDDTPVGPHSPFRKLCEIGGSILMLGCGLSPNTSMHGVEEIAHVPYLFKPEPVTYTCVNEQGAAHLLTVKRHNFSGNGREILQRYERVKDILPDDKLKSGYVLDAVCYLIDARTLWEKAGAAMKEDPWFFVTLSDDAF